MAKYNEEIPQVAACVERFVRVDVIPRLPPAAKQNSDLFRTRFCYIEQVKRVPSLVPSPFHRRFIAAPSPFRCRCAAVALRFCHLICQVDHVLRLHKASIANLYRRYSDLNQVCATSTARPRLCRRRH